MSADRTIRLVLRHFGCTVFWRSPVTVLRKTGADSREVRRCSETRDPQATVSEQDASWFEIFVLDMLLVDIRKSICSVTMESAETYLVKLVPNNCFESTFCVYQSFVWFFIVS